MHLQVTIALLLTLGAARLAGAADAAALWSGQVQPLFDVYCVKCHGPIEQKSGLELDHPEAVMKGGDEGPVVVPGKPEKSRLYQYLAPDSDPHMPPKKQLSEAQRGLVRDWIAALDARTTKTGRTGTAPRSFKSVTDAIDVQLAEEWRKSRVKPAAPVDDRTWCRRVYLDLAGRIPTQAELDSFITDRSRSKRAALVDRLLQSEEYVVRMRELWDTFLMGRTKRENHEDRRRQNGWWTFLETAFRTNRPWNETVREILVARPDPARPDSKGASWFLYERRNEHQAIAEAVAPIVYGTKIDCAQCHDHPLAREIKQAHYWGLVAAFNRSKNVERGNDVAESAVGGFINFTNLKKESQPAVITLLDGRIIDEARPAILPKAPEEKSGTATDKKKAKKDAPKDEAKDSDANYVDPKAAVRVPRFSRRAAFADAVTQNNPLLARAFVNRMWAVLLGRGIVHPADEINARNAPSHPELLDWLTQDFAAHNHDIRRLVRGIVLSRAYALGAAPAPAPTSASSATAPPPTGTATFSSALERPLSAEQIARSWRVAAGFAADDDALRRRVIAAMPEVLPKDYNATFQQAQFLTFSPGLAELLVPASASGSSSNSAITATTAAAVGTVARLTAIPTNKERVRQAFLSTYGRPPDSEEAKEAVAFLNARPQQPAEAVRDLLWALMTSAEFLTTP